MEPHSSVSDSRLFDDYTRAIHAVTILAEMPKRPAALAPYFALAKDLTKKLPWTESERPIVQMRLQAALRYLQFCEVGSACHELMSLRRLLVRNRDELRGDCAGLRVSS